MMMASVSRYLAKYVAILLAASVAASQVAAAQTSSSAELTRWLDSYLSAAVSQNRASGVAVALISNGDVIFQNGYGFADLDRQNPVDAETTLFSIGSISKCFTATAIAQLIDRGAIRSLDDPANLYLERYDIPSVGGREVTIRDLLTHQGGFSDSIYGLATVEQLTLPVSAEAIAARVPHVVRRSGDAIVYSNAGYGLLGVLLEDITGTTLDDYFQDNILKPLGMNLSFVRNNPSVPVGLAEPSDFLPDGSLRLVEQNWAYHPFISPSAGVISTALDMSKFMQGHLDMETGLRPDLLSAATAHDMHTRLADNHEAVTGFGMSFVVHERDGRRVYENAGSGPGFQATMVLIPDQQIGLVVMIAGGVGDFGPLESFQRNDGDDMAQPRPHTLNMFEVRAAFLDQLLGPETHDATGFTPATASLQRFAGIYRSARRPHDTTETLLNPGSFIRVEMTNDTLLTIDNVEGYRQISENVFWKPGLAPFVESAGSAPLYAFLTDEAGRVTGVTPQISTDVFERVRVGLPTIARLGGASLLVVLSGLAGGFWSVRSARQRWARRLAVALAVTSAAIPITAIVGMALTGNLLLAVAVMDVSLFVALAMVSNLAAALCIALITILALCWRDHVGRRTPGGAANLIHWSLVALSGVGLLGALNYFSLVGLHLP